jgi:hypothetical protein
VWAVYTLFPDYQDIQSWRKRARILVFGCIKDRQTKDIQQQLKQQGWVTCPTLLQTPRGRVLEGSVRS